VYDLRAANARLLGLIADIRAAVGDPTGKLMQDELVVHCRSLRLTDAERAAIQTAMNAYGENNDDRECAMIEATLWGLLERTK
jgi:hypothetical protein